MTYKTFENSNDYSLKNQIERAAISVMNNIAEGFERQTNKEFKQFLYIAKGSCGEVRSMLYIAMETKKLSLDDFNKLYKLTIDIAKLLTGLIKTLLRS